MSFTDREFKEFIDSTKKIVLHCIAKHLYPRFYHSADDVAQEVYLRAYKSLIAGKFEYRSKLSTWVYTIARNESIRMNGKLMKEEEKRRRFSKTVSLFHEPVTSELEKPISPLLDQLPEKYRQVLHYHLNGYSEKEIAQKLSIPAGTVKSRMSRGKNILSNLLQEGGVQSGL